MINEVYNYSITEEKTIEKIVSDKVVMINHMILPKDDCLPVHNANSNVYMIVTAGTVTLELDKTPAQKFKKGSIINIEFGTLMSVCNKDNETLELFVIKAPGPAYYQEQ